MASPQSSPTHVNLSPIATAALRTSFLVARKVSSSSRSQVPRRSFPPDTFSSRIGTTRPSPLGPKGARKLAKPSLDDNEDGDDWSSDAEVDGGEEGITSTTDDDDGDLGVVKRAKSRKFAKGVGKMRFFSAPSGRRRERTPSYSPKKDKNDTPAPRVVAPSSSSPSVTPSRSLHSSPSKPLRATSTPFTPTASRLLTHSSPTTTPSKEATKQPSFSPESIGSGTSFPNVPSPTSSQSSWSLITPGIPQTDVFDTSIDSVIIIHDLPTISDKFIKGPSASSRTPPPAPAGLPTVIATAPTPTPLSPFAKPFVSTTRARTHRVERSIDFAELMGRGGMGWNDATSSSSMQEKKGSPERAVLRREIMRAVTPSKPSREQVAERMVRLIMKRSVGSMAFEEQGGDPIAVMVGPESLPYARNPSGVDGSVVGADGRLNVWMSSAQDPECEYVEAFQRRPGSSNLVLRGNHSSSNSVDSTQAQAYSHPSVFRIQPHGRGRIIPQVQTEHHRPPTLPFKSSPLVSSIHPCPSPSYSVSSFDSRVCFPPSRYGPSPTEFAFPSLPSSLQHPYHQLQQQHQLHQHQQHQQQPQHQHQFEEMGHQQSRQLSNQELFDVASNILGIGLGRPSAFARSQFSGSGVSTPSSLGTDFERQASQLERILLLSTIATTLRSASDSVVSTIPTRDPPTPRSISSPSPGSQLEVPAIVPSPVVQEPAATVAPVLLDVESAAVVPRVATPYPHTVPLPPINDPAIARVGQQQPHPTEEVVVVVEEPRARTETYQVRRGGGGGDDATRSRANTIDSRSPIGSAIHNHSHHDENYIFLRAGRPPGFAAGGARRPGPRAGLPPRTMAMRAIDAMTKATLREGKGGGALVASERKEVFERGEKVVDVAEEKVVAAPIQVGDLWRVRAGAVVEEETKVAAGEKKGKRDFKETRTADGFLTLGSLSAMFGESSKTNVPASLPARPKQEKPKSFVAALSVGLPKKPDFPGTSPLPSPTLVSPSVVEAAASTTIAPSNPRPIVVASPKAKDGKPKSRKRPSVGSKAAASALRSDSGAC